MRYSLLVMVSLLFAVPAQADWQYARWGMSQAQLLAASGGKASSVAPKSDFGQWGHAFATATYMDGGLTFSVEFNGTRDSMGFGLPTLLANIRFGLADNCDRILPYLKSKYRLARSEGDYSHTFADGSDELRYTPSMSRCSFRRFRAGRYK